MSFLKLNGLIKKWDRNTTKMLFGSSSKIDNPGSAGCDAIKGNEEDIDGSSSSSEALACALNTFYTSRKFSHELPANTVSLNFDPLYGIPTGVFRETCGEKLGAGTGSGGACYQNPEYFSYHHMSYYDFHTALRVYRKVSPQTGRKK